MTAIPSASLSGRPSRTGEHGQSSLLSTAGASAPAFSRQPGRPWTINTDLFAQLWTKGEKAEVIAARVGCGAGRVSDIARRLGLPMRNPRPEPIDRDEFTRMWTEGVSTGEIMARFHRKRATIHSTAARFGLPPRSRGGDRRPAPAPEPEPAKPPMRIDGGYLAVAELAAREGITLRCAMARLHRMRS